MNKKQLIKIIYGAIEVKKLAQAYGDSEIIKQAEIIYEITKQLVKSQGHTDSEP